MKDRIEIPTYPLAPGARSGTVARARVKYRAAIELIDEALEQTEKSFASVFAKEDSTASVRDRISLAAAQNRKGRR